MSKTNELLGKLGKQLRDFPPVSTFAGAKQAENAIAQGKPLEIIEPEPPKQTDELPQAPVSGPPAEESPPELGRKSRAGSKAGKIVADRSVKNFSVTLHPSDIETMQEMRFLIMKEAKKPTVSVSETIRIALRSFRSDKPLSKIIAEVEELDGRGMWRK